MYAQEGAKTNLSLEEAQSLAMQNNLAIANAQLDVEIAKKKVWETTAIGLPQISGSVDYNLNPDPAELPNPMGTGSITLGEKHNLTYQATISQLIFSGEYIVGLRASKAYMEISTLALDKEKEIIKEATSNAYFNILIAKENLQIVDSSALLIEGVYNEMKEMHAQGFVSDIDVLQMKLNLINLHNTKVDLEQRYKLANDLLGITMNADSGQTFVLTDNLESVIEKQNFELSTFNLDGLVDYKMLENQVQIYKLSKQREISTYLPTLSAFYRHKEFINEPDILFEAKDMVGATLSIPIFSSGARSSRVKQADFELQKAMNNKESYAQQLELGYNQALSIYNAALLKYDLEKENRSIAKLIFTNTIEKQKQGMASSMDVSQSQTQFLEAQGSYSMAVYELLNSRIALQKALGVL